MKHFFSGMLLLLSLAVFAQPNTSSFTELPFLYNEEQVFVETAGDLGCYVLGESEEEKGAWGFTLFDKELNKVYEHTSGPKPDLSYYNHTFDGRTLWVRFEHKKNKQEVHLLCYELAGKNTTHTTKSFTLPEGFKQKWNFSVVNGFLYVRGVLNKCDVVAAINTATSTTTMISHRHQKNDYLSDLYTINKPFSIAAFAEKTEKGYTLVNHVLSGDKTLHQLSYSFDGNERVEKASVYLDDKGHYITTGTAVSEGVINATGLFWAKHSPSGEQEDLKFFRFLDLSCVEDFIDADSLRYLRKWEEKGKKTGWQATFNLHPQYVTSGKHIFCGEFYSEVFRPTNNPNYPIFDGFVCNYFLMVAFDDKGNLLWNNATEMNDNRNMKLHNLCTYSTAGDEITLLYPAVWQSVTLKISGRDVMENKKKKDLVPAAQVDRQSKLKPRIISWEGNGRLAWGRCKSKNSSKKALFLSVLQVQ